MKKYILLLLLFLISCSNIELVLQDSDFLEKKFKNDTLVVIKSKQKDIFSRQLYSFFGNNKNGNFILVTDFVEKKENRLVRKNQVAEKIDYELKIKYDLFYKNYNCKIHTNIIISKFSFVPKSFGYNFGTDRSLEKLYKNSFRNNIQKFIDSTPSDETNCLYEN